MAEDGKANDGVFVVYDGECPVCRTFCTKVRIEQAAGTLHLVDARKGGPLMDEITARGLDIDQGMVVKIGDEMWYGADAIHVLATLSTRSGLFNRLAYWSFRSRGLSRVIYPACRAVRNLLLRVLGIRFIRNLESARS